MSVEPPVDDPPAPRNAGYRCPDCHTEVEHRDGERVHVDKDKVRRTHGRSAAETLADIHAAKTGHSREAITVFGGDGQ